jgi:hypothetical protein
MKNWFFAVVIACFLSPFLPADAARVPDIVKISTDIPDFVSRLPVRNDMLYGYGAAIGANLDESIEVAENHARMDLAGRMVEGIPAISEYVRKISGGTWDPSFIQILLLADRHLMDALTYTGVTVVESRVQTPDGAVWYLISVKKRDAINIITTIDRLLR